MFKFFTSDLIRNLIKILCLSVGLAVGMLLVAKIYFEQTYDAFFPNIDRLYRITESSVQNGQFKEYPAIPGGTAPELQRNIAQIEAATRFTDLTDHAVVKLEDGRKFDVDLVVLADSCLFDVVETPILQGNPHEVLATQDRVMIPRSLAEKIGGDVVGLSMSVVEFGDDYKAIVGGVYEDYPLNSTIPNAIYVSMPTIGKFTYDGSENLLGNDRYMGIVRLSRNADPKAVNELAMQHLKTKIDDEAFAIVDYKVWLRPLAGSYSSQPGIKTMSWLMGLLAAVILLCAGLNYLLIVIGQLSARGKEMAIRKCFGTGRLAIFRMMISESLFFLVVSLGLGVLLAFSFSDLCRELLGYSPSQLFATPGVWRMEAVVCAVLLVITGVVPAVIYCRTPVSSAFHPHAFGRKIWKLALLAIQFFATAMVMCLLVLIGRQYSLIGNLDLGVKAENVGMFYRHPLSANRTRTIMKELSKLPFVEGVATGFQEPTQHANGDNMWTEGKEENEINIADLYYVNPEYFDVFGIRFLQGHNFNVNADSTVNEVVVEERMVEVLQKYFGETDSDIIGKTIYVTGHETEDVIMPLFTIVGVVNNVKRGSFESEYADTRAGIYFPTNGVRGNVFVRFSELTPDNLRKAQEVIDSFADGVEIYITPYITRIDAKRHSIKMFGTAVMVVGIAIILIALIGLIGYVADEVNRRAKEIAIRKVNGTSAAKIVRIFCADVLKVALPSLLLGGIAAIIVGQRWLEQFTDRVSISPVSLAACLLVLLMLIIVVVILNTYRVAQSNPVNHLRSE